MAGIGQGVNHGQVTLSDWQQNSSKIDMTLNEIISTIYPHSIYLMLTHHNSWDAAHQIEKCVHHCVGNTVVNAFFYMVYDITSLPKFSILKFTFVFKTIVESGEQ